MWTRQGCWKGVPAVIEYAARKEDLLSKGTGKATPEARREWLKGHPNLWVLPLNKIRDAMAQDGLCARTTYPPDIKLGKMLAELTLPSSGR